MKRLVVILLALSSTQCFSQSFTQGIIKRLSFGLKAGANYSNYTNADFATQGIMGFHAGALVNFRFTDNFSVQEEFLFSSQGAKLKDDVFGNQNFNVYYVTVPFMLKYKTNFGLYLEAGPQTGLRTSEDTKIDNFAKKIDLAFAGGIGFQTRSGFGIGARYIAGISKVGDFNISSISTDFKTNVVQASIFYVF